MSVYRNGLPVLCESLCINSRMNGTDCTTFKNVLDEGCGFSLMNKRDNLPNMSIIRYDSFKRSIRNMAC